MALGVGLLTALACSTETLVGPAQDATILPYDAALHARPDSARPTAPQCFRAQASAAQASDVAAFGYHGPLVARAACTERELTVLLSATAAPSFTSLQHQTAAIAGIEPDCKACLLAEYDAAQNPHGSGALWGVSGMRTDTPVSTYALPSNRQWLNTAGCLERTGELSFAEAQAASNRDACRSLFCPQGSGGCGAMQSEEALACTAYVEAPGGACEALAAAVSPALEAKLSAFATAKRCAGVREVATAFCGGRPEPLDAGATDAGVDAGSDAALP